MSLLVVFGIGIHLMLVFSDTNIFCDWYMLLFNLLLLLFYAIGIFLVLNSFVTGIRWDWYMLRY